MASQKVQLSDMLHAVSALCCILFVGPKLSAKADRHCGVPLCTPHSSGFARLELGAFCFAIPSTTFYNFIKG
jgi:hypothetical protein